MLGSRGNGGGPPPAGPRVALALLAVAAALLPVGAFPGAAGAGVHAASGCGDQNLTFGAPVNVSGQVVDAYSGAPLGNVTVHALDYTCTPQTTTADVHGRFTVRSVPGTVYITVDPPGGYQGVQIHVAVGNVSIDHLVIGLAPVALLAQVGGEGTLDAPVEAALLAAVLGGAAAGVSAYRLRQARRGRSPRLLSRFGQYVLVRSLLIPFQLVAVLVVVYLFGSYFPAVALADRSGCFSLLGGSCAPCPVTSFVCQNEVFWGGLGSFLQAIFGGNWGLATFGHLQEPAVDFVMWWVPNSVQLAALALALSVAIGYPLGIVSGWRTEGVLDRSLRGVSLILLLIPTFLVVLFLISLAYSPWYGATGNTDTLFGMFPSQDWYAAHGGTPSWVGFADHTAPTGLPLADAALHGDWPFFAYVGLKLFFQALAIALIYVSIYFRFARHAISEAAGSEAIRAARSRGVPEATLAWRHAGRRALPVLVLIFGLTLPVYLGTQALVEVLFSDSQGFGTILFSEMTQVASSGFGVTYHGVARVGNLYQVTIFFLALFVLIANLCADIVARLLDHTLEGPEGR